MSPEAMTPRDVCRLSGVLKVAEGRPRRLYVARRLVLLGALFAAAGCGGGSQAPTSFAAVDADRIASVRPATPGWAWPESPVTSGSCIPGDKPHEDATDPLQTALDRRFAATGFICDAGSKWQDDKKLGSLSALRFETPTGAHEGLAAFRVFAHGWGERSGEVIGDDDVEELGDEATRLRVGGNGVQVTYLWRRANLVLQAHVHCFGICPADVDALTRIWVDAIDKEARTGG